MNFFLYACTGKAFRHELKRLFLSVATRMHLRQDSTNPKNIDRRPTAIHIMVDQEQLKVNHLFVNGQCPNSRRPSCSSNFIPSHFNKDDDAMNSYLTKKRSSPTSAGRTANKIDMSYYLQKITNV